jgi:hypothetical protein
MTGTDLGSASQLRQALDFPNESFDIVTVDIERLAIALHRGINIFGEDFKVRSRHFGTLHVWVRVAGDPPMEETPSTTNSSAFTPTGRKA